MHTSGLRTDQLRPYERHWRQPPTRLWLPHWERPVAIKQKSWSREVVVITRQGGTEPLDQPRTSADALLTALGSDGRLVVAEVARHIHSHAPARESLVHPRLYLSRCIADNLLLHNHVLGLDRRARIALPEAQTREAAGLGGGGRPLLLLERAGERFLRETTQQHALHAFDRGANCASDDRVSHGGSSAQDGATHAADHAGHRLHALGLLLGVERAGDGANHLERWAGRLWLVGERPLGGSHDA
mmetsp:Transcript_27337/g.86881  ORF Transcript_27337/g.86881 Transcript_27337/m.86881 type:complete len:244 (-) Transcript_27337:1154-1885(-)